MSDYFEMTSDQQDALLDQFYDEITDLEEFAKDRRGDNRNPSTEEYYNEISATLDGWLRAFGLDSDNLTDVTLANLELGEFEVDILLGLSRLFNLKADIIIFELEASDDSLTEGRVILDISLSLLKSSLEKTEIEHKKNHTLINLGHTYRRYSHLFAKNRKRMIDLQSHEGLNQLDESFRLSIDYNILSYKKFRDAFLIAIKYGENDHQSFQNAITALKSCVKSYEVGVKHTYYKNKYAKKLDGLYRVIQAGKHFLLDHNATSADQIMLPDKSDASEQ